MFAAHARSPDVTAIPDLEAPNPLLEDVSSALDNRFASTPLSLEDVAVVLEKESSAPSGRRASLNPAHGLAMPSFRSMKVLLFVESHPTFAPFFTFVLSGV
jgi:hypothetical protein